MQNGYYFCADILGFSRIIKNLDHIMLDKKINDWIVLIEKLVKENNLAKYQLISDTIFIAIDDDIKQLINLISFARALLNESVLISFPVRGAISYGAYTWGQLAYGKAVIDAHELENKQNWIGITVDNGFPIDGSKVSGLITYPVPMKNSEIILYRAISWEVPSFEKLAELTNKDGLGNRELDWDWGEKISNTVMFGIYLDALKKNGKVGEKFHGLNPIHFIDLTLRKTT